MNRTKRWTRSLFAAVLVAATISAPAWATQPDENGDHTVTICHATSSLTNEWVIVTVDTAAFDGLEANDHTLHTTRAGIHDHELYENGTCYPSPED